MNTDRPISKPGSPPPEGPLATTHPPYAAPPFSTPTPLDAGPLLQTQVTQIQLTINPTLIRSNPPRPPDEYLVDFHAWKPGRPADAAFSVPRTCDDAKRAAARRADSTHGAPPAARDPARASRVLQAAALMPWARAGGRGGGPGAGNALGARLAARAAAAAFVSSWDARAAGFSVGLNRFRWGFSSWPRLARSLARRPSLLRL